MTKREDAAALERLAAREEVLEICYWYEGEGLGRACDGSVLAPFLNCDVSAIELALRELHERGLVAPVEGGAAGYRLTPAGQREGGRLFADSFADLQKQGHGECATGCCEEDDHSRCGEHCTERSDSN